MSKQMHPEQMDQRWGDLPLPDADMAWQDMSALLDKDNRDRKTPLVPPYFAACAGWALLLFVIAGGTTLLLWNKEEDATELSSGTGTPAGNHASSPLPSSPANNAGTPAPQQASAVATTIPANQASNTPPDPATPNRSSTDQPDLDAPLAAADPANHSTSVKRMTGASTARRRNEQRSRNTKGARPAPAKGASAGSSAKAPITVTAATTPVATTTPGGGSNSGTNGNTATRQTSADTTAGAPPAATAAAPDTAAKVVQPEPMTVTDTAATKPEQPKKPARRSWTFSAGIGLNQALPIDGQKASGANYQGKPNLLGEYVPSFYVRATKGRLFIQAEARFNAPQYLPAFTYEQKTTYDTAAQGINTRQAQLRKAWYHQFPVTANYQLHPRFSVGAGMQWSVLYRAAGTSNISRRDLGNNSMQLLSSPLQVPRYNDSFLYKTQWQLLLQTEFHWRRWTVGIRYRADLEPFIRYTKPDGEVVDQKNEALEATLRFRLWQQKKRR